MAATDWEKFVIIYVLLLIHVFVCAEQPCELAKIHVQGENGNKQVLTMKHLKPSQCGACHRGDEALSCGSSVDAAASRFAARAVPRTLDLAPRVTLVFDEILIGCDSLTDEVSGNKTGKQQQLTKDLFQQYSKAIVENSLLPFMSHHKDTNLGIAYGVVLMSMGYIDESVEHFNRLIKAKGGQGNTAVLYYARGIAYARKGLLEYGLLALADLSQAVDLDPVRADTYTKRAEIYLALGQYTESLADINKAIEIKPAGRLYFLKGTIEFAFDDLAGAEKDFRRALTEGGEEYRMDALYYLGLTLYYRGKVRNSIGTFKDAIQQKKDYIEAQTGLGQAYRELGDYKEALKNFNVSLHLDTSHLLTVRLRGSMHYHSGEIQESLGDFNKCLLLDPNNKVCRYMQGLAFSSLGQFYEGIKTQTKVIVYNNWPMMKMSPEFIKAHYLREYSRYLHRHLESPVSSVNPDRDLNGAFRDHWAKLLPFTFREGYQEQPGLQPHIP
ncbi:Tetratricopeptide repeat protein 13 [Lamellibrachia satsuma]|nr:Tetratricopeptide repeat protein 13 [Lamellibrachia satsuma]